jgi:PAS domain S-box-containing protein
MAARKARLPGTLTEVLPLQIYRAIVDTIPHIVWTARPDGAVEFFNAHVLKYTGITREQLSDWGWKRAIHPDDLDICVSRWKRALASGRGFEADYRMRRADGEYRWHHHIVMALRDAGRIVMWYGTGTDIDEQKKAVRLLEQARHTLESLVMARTHAFSDGRDGEPELDRLSDRERQVLQLIVDGRTSAEVGERLGLSPKSIDTYRSRLMAKLGIEDLPTLVKFAIRHGLTTIS